MVAHVAKRNAVVEVDAFKRRVMKRMLITFVVLAGTLMPVAAAQAAGPLAPRVSPAGGALSAQWWQWLYALKVHGAGGKIVDPALIPDLDNGRPAPVECRYGQTGTVWFLAGTFSASGTANRSCTIPRGTTIVLPRTDRRSERASAVP